MLIEFSVTNFLSFRDRATLSLVAARPDRSLPNNVGREAGGHKLDLLRSVAVFGPNASGKSNLIKAIRFGRMLVLESAQESSSDAPIPVMPFLLDDRKQGKPSEFEFVFVQDGARYRYSFAVDSRRVWRESLNVQNLDATRTSSRVLFEREEDGFYFGPSWPGAKARIAELTRPNALFLSVATQLNHEQAKRIRDWFQNRLKFVDASPSGGEESAYTERVAYEYPESKARFLRFLQEADVGILDFNVEAVPFKQSHVWKNLPVEVRRQFPEAKGEEPTVLEVGTTHSGVDADGQPSQVQFDLRLESDGTQKLFALSAPWVTALREGICVVADELDLRLHPLLTKWLISWFHSQQSNPKGAQLVFATHDDNLLDLEAFRRDQIWFAERDQQGASSLYSLWEFKKQTGRGARKEENIRRGYLAGRYGAIPFLEDVPE